MLKAEKANIETNKISLPIKSLQYHTNNRHATWLELFFDLVFVASLDVVTHNLAHVHQGHIELEQLVLFPVEFLPIWWIFYDSFHSVERIKGMKHGYTLLYSNMLFAIGLIILANLIRHTILNDLDKHDFRMLTFLDVTSFFIGKQANYYKFFPPMRPYIWFNSVACISATVASTFLSRPEYALVGMTLSMLFYVFVNYTWPLKRDISPYLE